MAREIELLSPAGSYECLVAALKSGADAVYVGGAKFGARAFAGNFQEEELKQAIDLMHLHGKKLFLTINTLLKEEELNEQLYDYLLPLYEHGLDAVIVQDIGVLNFVKKRFPGLGIHASTQMTVTSQYGVKFLEKLGVERIVTSRELSLSEVIEITQSTSLEVESFVHGALCYGYSGQCVFSSIIGGRSGNRGQCAQPCRLPYEVEGKSGHFLSLKDICTLEHIDKLIESGVYSFKIEGRMKKPEYVACVTSMYRKYIDKYLNTGKLNVTDMDMDKLRDVFSRGEFHTGYWLEKNGPQMVTFDKPSHTGVPLLKAVKQTGRSLKVEVLKALNKGDIIDIPNTQDNYTFGNEYKIGEIFELSLRKGIKIPQGAILNRTRNNSLIDQINTNLENNKLQLGVVGYGEFILGNAAKLTLLYGEKSITVEGQVVEAAQTQGAQKEKVVNQLNKTGTSEFYFEFLEIELSDGVFLPVAQIKDLRRKAMEELKNIIVLAFRRNMRFTENTLCKQKDALLVTNKNNKPNYSLYISQLVQLEEVIKGHSFQRIYLNYNIFMDMGRDRFKESVVELKSCVYLVLPHICRQKYIEKLTQIIKNTMDLPIAGFMVRNMETIELLNELKYKGEIILDHHIHIFNKEVKEFWLGNGVTMVSASNELTRQELNNIGLDKLEVSIYGHTTMMVSAQCIKKTTKTCDRQPGFITLKDRKQANYITQNCCDFCYNIIHNGKPTSLLEFQEKSWEEYTENELDLYFRVSLTKETKTETKQVLKLIEEYQLKGAVKTPITYTLGNINKGIR